MRALEGANCGDLPSFVVDKYFDCDVGREPLRAMVARAICDRCVVVLDCRDEALTMQHLPTRGIIGGVSASEVERARAWRRFEHGLTDSPPKSTRPDWLNFADVAHTVEQWRTESDPDEPQPEA